MELPLDGGDVRIDVGVVVLEVVQDERARAVVDELRALVEEGGVVLIRLDDEWRARAQGRGTEARAGLEVRGHAADQEPGLEPRLLENPCKERGRGGLAMCTGHGQDPTVAQHFARQPFRTRCIGNTALEQRLDDGLAARHDIAHDDHVGRGIELRGVVAFDELYPERLELRAHRRVDVAVGAGDAMAGGARDVGNAAHEGPANSQNVNVHNAAGLYRSSGTPLHPIADTADAVTDLAARLASCARIGLDTEFLRERTYRAELCLIQLSAGDDAVCVDPLAVTELGALAGPLTAGGIVKVMHASRQDLEVLLPAVGLVRPVFDTQIAAALAGLAAQIGYAELVRRLLDIELPKAHTRTDWSRRPLSPEQIEYALDDVRHLIPLQLALGERLEKLGRSAWLAEELAQLGDASALATEPEEAWRRLKGLRGLDAARERLARGLA